MDLGKIPRRLATRDLHLRPLEWRDVAAVFELLSDAETVRYWTDAPISDIGRARELLARDIESGASGDSLSWAITRAGADTMIGKCVLFNFNETHQRAEIGYMLNRAFWRRGWMQQTLEAVIRLAFEELGLHRIEADVDPHNTGSLALLEKLGFRREGYFRERWCVDGRWRDAVMLGLLYPAYSRAVSRR